MKQLVRVGGRFYHDYRDGLPWFASAGPLRPTAWYVQLDGCLVSLLTSRGTLFRINSNLTLSLIPVLLPTSMWLMHSSECMKRWTR